MAKDASIIATLKGTKGVVQSEWMDEAQAEQELERITSELNDDTGSPFVKLGAHATVNRADVMSVGVYKPPTFV